MKGSRFMTLRTLEGGPPSRSFPLSAKFNIADNGILTPSLTDLKVTSLFHCPFSSLRAQALSSVILVLDLDWTSLSTIGLCTVVLYRL